MVFVTGDLHGNFERFKPKYFPEQERMTKRDIMICAGDFGGVWFGDSRDDETLDWLERLPFTLAFVCATMKTMMRWNDTLLRSGTEARCIAFVPMFCT